MTKRKTKFISLFLMMMLLLFNFNTVFAVNVVDKDDTSKENQLKLQKKFYKELKELNFPDETIAFLTPEEITDIVSNEYSFIANSTRHELIISLKDDENEETINIPLSDKEFNEYNKDKEALAAKKLKEISINRPELEKYITTVSSDKNTFYTLSDRPSVSQFIDLATITLSVDVYDSSYDGFIYKTFGVNWVWDAPPTWTLTDAAGISYTGDWWTDIKATGGYYHNTYANPVWDTLYPDVCANGATIQYDIKTGFGSQDGRIWIRAGNVDSAVPYSLYSIYGGYGHTNISASGLSIGIDNSAAISISTTISSNLTKVSPNPFVGGLYTK